MKWSTRGESGSQVLGSRAEEWPAHRYSSLHLPTHRGLFKTDRVLGTAQLKLDMLETACEVHEILEVRRWRVLADCVTSVTPGIPEGSV